MWLSCHAGLGRHVGVQTACILSQFAVVICAIFGCGNIRNKEKNCFSLPSVIAHTKETRPTKLAKVELNQFKEAELDELFFCILLANYKGITLQVIMCM